MAERRYRTSVRVTGALVIVVLVAVAVEATARLALAVKAPVRAWLGRGAAPALDLDPYEEPDPRHPAHWRLKAGFSRTLEELIEDKRQSGRVLGVEHLTEYAARLGIAPGDRIMQVSADGYKGPELDRRGVRPRVLTLGDSCTFGSWFDRYAYPRVLEREWRRAGLDIEVVNGGVEGYSPSNVLLRIEEFKALRPRLTTIYIGWNALYAGPARVLPEKRALLQSPELIAKGFGAVRRAVVGAEREARLAYGAAKNPDRAAPAVAALERYIPPFLPEVERIVSEMQSAGSEVVIVTLPGLFTMDEEPTGRALEIGHLPPFTDNPYVLAKRTERYNASLRDLARRRGLRTVDLERWSREALAPRDAWFMDSVHLYERGQERIGVYMAAELRPVVSRWSRR